MVYTIRLQRYWDEKSSVFGKDSIHKARDNTIQITIYYVVWTCLTRVGCFDWLAHYKRIRIVNK